MWALKSPFRPTPFSKPRAAPGSPPPSALVKSRPVEGARVVSGIHPQGSRSAVLVRRSVCAVARCNHCDGGAKTARRWGLEAAAVLARSL